MAHRCTREPSMRGSLTLRCFFSAEAGLSEPESDETGTFWNSGGLVQMSKSSFRLSHGKGLRA